MLGFDIVRAYRAESFRNELRSHGEKWTATNSREGQLWISYSLYGTDNLYLDGILKSCDSYRKLFPGWRPLIFVGDSVPTLLIEKLINDFDSHVVRMVRKVENHTSMFWRFLAFDAVGGDAVIFRDADSRASRRERGAIDEWLASGKTFHIMRDHIAHTLPIMGGMWGARLDSIANISQIIDDYEPDSNFSSDQRFLASVVYPLAVRSCMVHSDSNLFEDSRTVTIRPFHVSAENGAYVGQGVMSDGIPRSGH